jgi:hypothetical protein
MFFDDENYNFKLKFLGRETIDTNFGKVKTFCEFRPYVMAGHCSRRNDLMGQC